MPCALILSVGIDSPLLATRDMLLQLAGYSVLSVQSAKEAADYFLAGDFDLVLLCHSLPREDRERLASLIRAAGSLTPVVTVAEYTDQHDVLSTPFIESDPKRMLEGVGDVLTREDRKGKARSPLRNASGPPRREKTEGST